jgi:hypothetical protein
LTSKTRERCRKMEEITVRGWKNVRKKGIQEGSRPDPPYSPKVARKETGT